MSWSVYPSQDDPGMDLCCGQYTHPGMILGWTYVVVSLPILGRSLDGAMSWSVYVSREDPWMELCPGQSTHPEMILGWTYV